MADFTKDTFVTLIKALAKQGYSFSTVEGFISGHPGKVIALRHDVDTSPENSLQFARIEAERRIKGTYYFRMLPQSYNEKIIKEIYALGHEVGYHYEDFSLAASRHQASGIRRQKMTTGPQDRKTAGLQDKGRIEEKLAEIAIESFRENLEKLRKLAPVSTICMHGSPMSKWDSRLLWKYYDYRDFGIIGEPYFDINFDDVLYLTDTGRRWDGNSFNIRDKAFNLKGFKKDAISAKSEEPIPNTRYPAPLPKFHSTFDIIKAAESGHLPDKIMMTFHPQRWTGKPIPWVKELVWQNMKNQVKYLIVKLRSE